MKFCVVGDTGLLGGAFVRALAARPSTRILGFSTTPAAGGARYSHEVLDAAEDFDTLNARITAFAPDVLINTAAWIDLAGCEEDPARAERLNAELPGKLARSAQTAHSRYVHVSTDQVFDGSKKSPYTEADAASPVHVYGKTKRAGEKEAAAGKDALILRTNIVGFRTLAGRPTFAQWLCAALDSGERITLAEDFVTSSIHTAYFIEAALLALEKGMKGLYHLASHDAASKFEFGKRLAEAMRCDFSAVTKGRLSELNLKPKRPSYLALDSGRFEKDSGRPLPRIQETALKLAAEFRARQKEKSHAA